jgi:hypothetical protein
MSTPGAGSRAWRGATLALGLPLGVLLLALAAPRLVAAVLGTPADRVVFYLEDGQRVTDEALTGLVVARRAAAGWHATAQDFRDIAAAELMLAHRGANSQGYEDAERALGLSLAMAPVDPHGWARLAHVAWLQDRDADSVAALRASIQTGSYEPTLAAWRVVMMLRLWEAASVEDRTLFLTQIRQLAWEDPDSLAEIRNDPQAAPILADLLGLRIPGATGG